jgi:signal peptidase I
MPLMVKGESMTPTLSQGQLVGVNKLAYCVRAPRRGEIVLVNTGRELHAKRILGLPGEEIALTNGVFYVNGWPLSEPYVQSRNSDSIGPGRLGPNRFLVAGDNRRESIVAVVNRERIVGPLVWWR